MMSKTAAAAALIAVPSLIAMAVLGTTAHAQEPLAIAKQGYFFVGSKYSAVGDKQVGTLVHLMFLQLLPARQADGDRPRLLV